MKIAICFSGQIRTGIESSENIKRFLGDLYPFCDFFIHTWDVNKNVQYCGTRIFTPEENITEDVISKIEEIYRPKKMIMENFNEIKDEISSYGDTIKYLWYSFNKSIEYKKEYEIENNFTYDLVVKLRFDIIFPPERRLLENYLLISDKIDNTIYIENCPIITDNDKSLEFIDDVFFIGNSKNMDIKSSYYDVIIDYRYNGFELYEYLKNNGINIVSPDKYYPYTIYRTECLKYSSLEQFEECRECNDYYYTASNNDKTACKFLDELKEKYIITKEMCDAFSSHIFLLKELKRKK